MSVMSKMSQLGLKVQSVKGNQPVITKSARDDWINIQTTTTPLGC